MITIHNFARGARGLRLFWICEEMGLPYRRVTVPFPASPAYRALHPLAQVPFLEDEGGVAISESVAIALYLAHRYGPTPLLPAPSDPRYPDVLRWVVFSEATLGGALNPLMAAHFGAPDQDKRNWSVIQIEAKLDEALGFLVASLGDRSFLVGSDLTLADICVGTALGMWKGALGKTLPEPLAAWRGKLAAREAYQRALAAP
jgi:glutathione S-transferase